MVIQAFKLTKLMKIYWWAVSPAMTESVSKPSLTQSRPRVEIFSLIIRSVSVLRCHRRIAFKSLSGWVGDQSQYKYHITPSIINNMDISSECSWNISFDQACLLSVWHHSMLPTSPHTIIPELSRTEWQMLQTTHSVSPVIFNEACAFHKHIRLMPSKYDGNAFEGAWDRSETCRDTS